MYLCSTNIMTSLVLRETDRLTGNTAMMIDCNRSMFLVNCTIILYPTLTMMLNTAAGTVIYYNTLCSHSLIFLSFYSGISFENKSYSCQSGREKQILHSVVDL